MNKSKNMPLSARCHKEISKPLPFTSFDRIKKRKWKLNNINNLLKNNSIDQKLNRALQNEQKYECYGQ